MREVIHQFFSYLRLLVETGSHVYLFVGAGSGLVPMYLTEIAPVNMRGAMGVIHQFGLTCGILVSQAIGLRQVLGKSLVSDIQTILSSSTCRSLTILEDI